MLNNKQISFLKSLANNIKPVIYIGKDGLSDNLYTSVDNAFNNRELIKVKVLKNCSISMNELIIEICSNCQCEFVQKIGKNIVLYKRNKDAKIFI